MILRSAALAALLLCLARPGMATEEQAFAVSAGQSHTCAVMQDARVACWGKNGYGQLGDGTTNDRTTPMLVPGLSGVIALATGDGHTCALKQNGSVACWGRNHLGQLGDGTTFDRWTPDLVPGLIGVASISAGENHTCALKQDGTMVCWGGNYYGQLGDGTTDKRTIPTLVAGLTGVAAISAGAEHTCALKQNGTVACWGRNYFGQLGDGTPGDHASPTVVPGLTGIAAISAGGDHTCALKQDGTIACWGYNGDGQLGDGTTNNRWTPVPVLGLTGAVALSAGGLPNGLISGLTDVTVEGWGTWFGGANNQRFFDFGMSSGAPDGVGGFSEDFVLNPGRNYFFLSPQNGAPRFALDPDAGGAGTGETPSITSSVNITNGAKSHFAVVYEFSRGVVRLYINGQRAGTAAAVYPLSVIDDRNNWIGRSNWQDPFYNGTIDEFRIYDGAFLDSDIAEHYAVGPDALPVPRPVLSFRVSGNQLTISWPASFTNYSLTTSTSLGSGANWTSAGAPVVNGGNNEVTVTTTGPGAFYRLEQNP